MKAGIMELDCVEIPGLKLRRNVSLAPFTSIGTGGRVRYLAEVEEKGALAELVRRLKQIGVGTARTFLLGKGTNLLVSDGGFDGVVIRLLGTFDVVKAEGERLVGGAAATLAALLQLAQEKGLSGLEFMSGIPGSIGGAIAMNAGAWGRAIWETVVDVHGIDSGGDRAILFPSEHETGYRRGNLPAGFIVTEAVLSCERLNPEDVARMIAEVLSKRRKIKGDEVRTFGSVFKNPEGHFAGRLLEEVEVKGMEWGGAMISKEHANFIVNRGNATSADVIELMRTMRRRVREKFGIPLTPEVVLLGFHESVLEE
jgi:UDP-N-acetylmuramate dehydrogenase